MNSEPKTVRSMPSRERAGAVIATIRQPDRKRHDLAIGAELSMAVCDEALAIVPVARSKRKRYTLAQLLEGATPKDVKALNEDIVWSREGDAVGRELACAPAVRPGGCHSVGSSTGLIQISFHPS